MKVSEEKASFFSPTHTHTMCQVMCQVNLLNTAQFGQSFNGYETRNEKNMQALGTAHVPGVPYHTRR
jgi:hypothetical protein